MSQLLVSVLNKTANTIHIWNSEEPKNSATIRPGKSIVIHGTHGHWNIPDCSKGTVFAAHHMEIRPSAEEAALYSFWGNDAVGDGLEYCKGTMFSNRTSMPGDFALGDGANILLEVNDKGPCAIEASVVGS